MTPTEFFQAKHGPRWAGIAHGPELTEALLVVNQSLLEEIKLLTTEQLSQPTLAAAYLARLQGQLLHEQGLLELATIRSEPEGELLPDYPDPVTELREQKADEQDATTSAGAGPYAEWMGEHQEEVTTASAPEVPSPKPKRKRRGSK